MLDYHGCDKAVAERLLSGGRFGPSQNDYDWLGPGIYFWEANPRRGIEYARELKRFRRGSHIKTPAVVGAVIDLGVCLDLTTSAGIAQTRRAYTTFKDIAKKAELPIPRNSKDLLRRNLDCAVFQVLHRVREIEEDPPLETIRGVFVEGDPLYPNGGVFEKTHVQICVCNPANIKGVFRVGREFLI